MDSPAEEPDDTNPMVFVAMVFVPIVVIAALWLLFALLMWGFQ